MAKRQVQHTWCDACLERGVERPGKTVYLGFAQQWWQLDLCDEDQLALLGDLESLLDSVGAPVQGPPLHV